MKENQKIFYLRIILIFLVLALVGGLFLDISFGNPQKSKWHYIFQKYYLKKERNWPENYSGVWNEWDENGELYVSTQLKDGIMHGEQTQWNSNPSYVHKRQIYKYGKLHGKQEYLRSNGTIDCLSIWENGERNGPFIIYYDNSKIKCQEEFKKGKLDGAYYGFYENGLKKIEGKYKNDRLFGNWYFLDKNGNLSKILNSDNIVEKKEIIKLINEFEEK